MSRKIATFYLGETIFGIDILLIREVNNNVNITPIPDAVSSLRGLMNLRGKVVTVIDLNVCLNRPPVQSLEKNRLLILKTDDEILQYQKKGQLLNVKLGEDIVCFIIDRMADVVEVEKDKILPNPPNLDVVEKELVEGVIKLGNQIIILLDVTAILNRIN